MKHSIAKWLANRFGKSVYIGKVFCPCNRHGLHEGWALKIDERFSLAVWNHFPFVTMAAGSAAKIEYASRYAWDQWSK